MLSDSVLKSWARGAGRGDGSMAGWTGDEQDSTTSRRLRIENPTVAKRRAALNTIMVVQCAIGNFGTNK